MSKDFDVKDALSADKNSLDYEWTRQPHLLHKASEMLADVTFKRDRAKAKHGYESAKMANIIRSDPGAFNIDGNVTDSKVKEIVLATPSIIKLETIYHEWEADVIAANGVRRALEHKKEALSDMTRLFLSGYWAKPYISNEDKEEYKEKSENEQTEALKGSSRIKRGKSNG